MSPPRRLVFIIRILIFIECDTGTIKYYKCETQVLTLGETQKLVELPVVFNLI